MERTCLDKLNWSEFVLMRTSAKRHEVLQDDMKKSVFKALFFSCRPEPLPLSFAFCACRPFGWPRIVWRTQISASLQGQLL